MGQRRHSRSRGLEFFLRDRKGKSSIGNRIVHHRIASAVTGLLWLRIATGSGHL